MKIIPKLTSDYKQFSKPFLDSQRRFLKSFSDSKGNEEIYKTGLGAVRKLRKGVFSLSWTTHLPSYVVESKGFTK